MHIATIVQVVDQPDNLGWTHPAFPGKTLVQGVDLKFYLEDSDGTRHAITDEPFRSQVRLNRDGWVVVTI